MLTVIFPLGTIPPYTSSMDIKKALTDKAYRETLTGPQLKSLLEKLNSLVSTAEAMASVPDNPADLAEKLSGGEWRKAPHLTFLADNLSRASKGLQPRTMISMPPRHGKSELTSFWYPLWLLAKNPTKKVILASYEASLAAEWGRRCRDAVVELGDKLGLSLDPSVTRVDEWKLSSGGGMKTAGAGGSLVGRGADLLIIDDPIKNYEEASSEIERENLWNWLQTTANTRIEPMGSVVLICTRWHEDDLLGRLERASRTGEGNIWNIIKLPAIAEEDDILGRKVGEALWPERYPLETEIRGGKFIQGWGDIKRGISPYNWSAIYQQNPTPDEGAAVDRKWWRYYEDDPQELVKQMDVVIQSWDLPFKDGDDNSYAVGQVWGRKGAYLYLIDQVRAHLNAPMIITAIRKFTEMYPQATAKLIEDKANGPAIIALLQHEVYGLIPVPVKGSKMARLQSIVPVIYSNNVFLPIAQTAPWIDDYVHEHAAFPNGQHDDQVDATSQALRFLTPQGRQEISKAWKEAREGPPPSSNIDAMTQAFHRGTKKSLKKAEKRLLQQSKSFMNTRRRARVW